MKKFISMVLALSTVASMASVAFAATTEPENPVHFDTGDKNTSMVFSKAESGDVKNFWIENSDELLQEVQNSDIKKFAKGDTVYMYVNDEGRTTTQMKKWKVRTEWLKGEDLLSAKADLVYKKTASDGYKWFVELTTKEAFDTSTADIVAFVTVHKGSYKNVAAWQTALIEFGTVGFGTRAPESDFTVEIDDIVNSGINFKNFARDDESTIEFESVGYYESNLFEQTKLNLYFVTDFDKEIGDLYADAANLEFVNFKASPKFNKWGLMYLYADEGSFIYTIKDGKLAKIDATYDADDESYKFACKSLSTFIISDAELDTTVYDKFMADKAAKDEATVPAEEIKGNPDTGR